MTPTKGLAGDVALEANERPGRAATVLTLDLRQITLSVILVVSLPAEGVSFDVNVIKGRVAIGPLHTRRLLQVAIRVCVVCVDYFGDFTLWAIDVSRLVSALVGDAFQIVVRVVFVMDDAGRVGRVRHISRSEASIERIRCLVASRVNYRRLVAGRRWTGTRGAGVGRGCCILKASNAIYRVALLYHSVCAGGCCSVVDVLNRYLAFYVGYRCNLVALT